MGNSDESSLLFDQPGPKGLKRIRIINWVATILFVVVLVLIVLRLHNPPDGETSSAGNCGSRRWTVKRGRTSICRAYGPHCARRSWR